MEDWQAGLVGWVLAALLGPVAAVAHRVAAGARPVSFPPVARLALLTATSVSAGAVAELMFLAAELFAGLRYAESPGGRIPGAVLTESAVAVSIPAVVVVVAAGWAAVRGRVRTARRLAAVPVLSAVAALLLLAGVVALGSR